MRGSDEVVGIRKNLAEYSQSKEWIHKGIRRFAQLGHEGIQVVGILNYHIIPPKTVSKKAIGKYSPGNSVQPWTRKCRGSVGGGRQGYGACALQQGDSRFLHLRGRRARGR